MEGVTASEGVKPACVTVTITGDNPVTVTMTLAARGEVNIFAVYVAVIVPLPDPEGVTVHHNWLLEAVHAELDVTEKRVDPASPVTG